MKITTRPYAHDKTRWQVDLRLMNPCNTEQEIRRRVVAPAGLSEAQARAWGEHQVHAILREVLAGASGAESTSGRRSNQRQEVHPASTPPPVSIRTARTASTSTPPRSPTPSPREPTLAEFFADRFEPEHVSLLKTGTQENYATNFRLHIEPHFGALPLSAIDEDRLSAFRATLRRRLGVRTVNLVLVQLAKILRFAIKVRALVALPDLEKLPVPRSGPKEVFTADEIEALLWAAAIDPTWELICLLALDAGLRASEICALEWRDVDLEGGMLTIQHNVFRGEKQTPKGTIGKIAMTSALCTSMARHRRREPVGPLVIYRRNYHTGHEWRPHTRHSLTKLLHRIQNRAGVRKSGPHLLRHTSLTRLSDLGASVYVIQAVARHCDLQTTQGYLHTQQATQTVTAAHLLDQAANARGRGKALAKPAKRRGT